ncbi:hypothetical protein J132_07547 [Termitomyces sp. J132]|nr:hypothetical protein C0989_011437 [Termitomyces sp. Mn162]KNZ74234.1 hypothetical protein J132_07547 [Termitomyces sp. J132]
MASALPRPDNGVVVASQSTSISAAVTTDTSSNSSAASGSTVGKGAVTSQSSTASTSAAVATDVSNGYGSTATYGSGSRSSYGSGADSFTSDNALASSTSSAVSSYSTPIYGSGSSNWGGSGYDSCVSQCIAQYGSPDSAYTPTSTGQSEGSTGTGATHTVIVAPVETVYRYVPFAVNASIGDTIKFMWGSDDHTVTKSSQLTPCNKTSDALFASGTQNKGFVFTQVVNDTSPVFFYCGTPGHCQKGMFGIINPPNAFGAPTSISASMESISANNLEVGAYASYTSNQTTNNLAASEWGGSIDLSALPSWAHELVVENVLFTRTLLASNPEILKEDGTIDLSSTGSTPLMIPQDVGADLNNAAVIPSPSTETPIATSEATAAITPTATGNGASSLASPRVFVALFAIAATFLAL